MLKNIILLLVVVQIAHSLYNGNYCNIESCGGEPHVLCVYPSEDPAPACNSVIQVGLTTEEKHDILNLHNELRQKVANGEEGRGNPGPQPPATNIQRMEWDDELADIAQRWTNQCSWGHEGECRDVERFQVGQNIAYHATTGDVSSIKVEDIVRGWYDEVQDYDANGISRFSTLIGRNGKQVGHYTQFVWAETNKLGCGAVKYPGDGYNWFYLVCNYGPAGNFFGEPVYITPY